MQVAYTALSHGSYTIEERLARWLLMCHDRVDGDDLPLVHEFLSMMLGVRRSGVTIAVQTLEATGLIKAKRGHIIVRDRAQARRSSRGQLRCARGGVPPPLRAGLTMAHYFLSVRSRPPVPRRGG